MFFYFLPGTLPVLVKLTLGGNRFYVMHSQTELMLLSCVDCVFVYVHATGSLHLTGKYDPPEGSGEEATAAALTLIIHNADEEHRWGSSATEQHLFMHTDSLQVCVRSYIQNNHKSAFVLVLLMLIWICLMALTWQSKGGHTVIARLNLVEKYGFKAICLRFFLKGNLLELKMFGVSVILRNNGFK